MSCLKKLAQASFEERVLECVDRGMGSLGVSTRHAIYWHIERTYGIKREEIPGKPQKFTKSLEAMFGVGASVLERLIVMEIRSVFEIPDKAESFEQAVKSAKGESK